MSTPERGGPLAGIRVIDLSSVLMGPYATQILGDLGADVVKIENGLGDDNRRMGDVAVHPDLSGLALNINRNKRSMSLDLKRERGREVLLRMLQDADVLVTNMRPDALARLRLRYEDVAELVPSLIYCESHGFRSDSAEANAPAYDDIIQARSGVPRLSETATGTAHYAPTALADKVTSLTIAYGVLAALVHRERTGEGQRVEVSMLDATLSFTLLEHLASATFPGHPTGYARMLNPHRGPFRTTDGYVAMMPYSNEHWSDLLGAVGRGELMEQKIFADRPDRLANANAVYAVLARIVAEHSTQWWVDLCHELDIPVSAVPTLDEIVADGQLHGGVIEESSHPVVGTYRQIAPPVSFSRSPSGVRRHAPVVGEQTRELLLEMGFAPSEVDELVADGTVAGPRQPEAARA